MKTLSLLPFALLLAACGDNLTHPPDRDAGGSGGSGAGGGSGFTCTPNLDGQIDAAELRPAFDTPVSYLFSAKARPVDIVGKDDGKGGRIWDFSPDIATDKGVTLTASRVADKWYADSFPAGNFASPLDATGKIDGVYSSTDSVIALLGIASVTEAPKEGKTLLVYEKPIDVYRFPLKPGASWATTAKTVMGAVINGLPYASTDTYAVNDDATGSLALHDFTFTQVHRIRTRVTLSPAAGASQSSWQVGFVFECFGEVARATSQNGEQAKDFTSAAEVRRLGK